MDRDLPSGAMSLLRGETCVIVPGRVIIVPGNRTALQSLGDRRNHLGRITADRSDRLVAATTHRGICSRHRSSRPRSRL